MLVSFLLLSMPSRLFAKAETSKITIEGASLKAPIEITDRKVLQDFRVWSGPLTTGNERQSLIVDWSQGVIPEPTKELPRYKISFYARLASPQEQLVYVVLYAYDPVKRQGYVYLPGRGDEWHDLNVGSILHGVEGNWFHAWRLWDRVAEALLPDARLASSASVVFLGQPPLDKEQRLRHKD